MKKLSLTLALAAGCLLGTQAAPAFANNCTVSALAPSVTWGGGVQTAMTLNCDHAFYVSYYDVLTDGFGHNWNSGVSGQIGPASANYTWTFYVNYGCPISLNRNWQHYDLFQIRWTGNQYWGDPHQTNTSPSTYYACM